MEVLSLMEEEEIILVLMFLWDFQWHTPSGKLEIAGWCSEEKSKLAVKLGGHPCIGAP